MSIDELKRAKIEVVLAELFSANAGALPATFATNALFALGVLGWEIVRRRPRVAEPARLRILKQE